MLRKLKYFRENKQLLREYSLEEKAKITLRKHRIYTVLASFFALAVILYLSYSELSPKIEVHKQTRLLAEKLIDIRLDSIHTRSSNYVFLSPEGDWFIQKHLSEKSCEKTQDKKLKLFFKKPENLRWKAFLMEKNENKANHDIAKRRIDSFCIDAIKGILVNSQVLEDPFFISIFSYSKDKYSAHLKSVKEIALQKNGAKIFLRSFP